MHRIALARTALVTMAVVSSSALAAPGWAGATRVASFPITASSVPGVVYYECTDHPIAYSVSPPADAQSWSVDFDVQAPDGTTAGGAIVTSLDPETGVETVQFCGSRGVDPGTYTVSGIYKVIQRSVVHQTEVTPFTFDLRRPYSAVTAEPSDRTPRLRQTVKVKVRVTEERPSGDYFGTEYAKVIVQRRQGDRWVKVRGAKGTTRGNGVVQIRFKQRWTGRTSFRAFANLGFPGRAASPSFVLRTRR